MKNEDTYFELFESYLAHGLTESEADEWAKEEMYTLGRE